MRPYYADDTVALYVGDMREVLPALGVTADLVLADPPYAETSLGWDSWPDGWLATAAGVARSLWCFGSMRMLLARSKEFAQAGWKLSQDIIWEKHVGPGFSTDRFKRVHEHAAHWYQGPWADQHTDVPRIPAADPTDHRPRGPRSADRAQHAGKIGPSRPRRPDGTRLMRSVIQAESVRGGIHPTQKPLEILRPLITYACPSGGLVLDPFAGSASTLDAARQTGRRAIGIEAREDYAEAAAQRLSQGVLDIAPA